MTRQYGHYDATPEQIERRRDICANEGATLDGRNAIIKGARLWFGVVATIDDKPEIFTRFAWATIERIIAKGGNFKS